MSASGAAVLSPSVQAASAGVSIAAMLAEGRTGKDDDESMASEDEADQLLGPQEEGSYEPGEQRRLVDDDDDGMSEAPPDSPPPVLHDEDWGAEWTAADLRNASAGACSPSLDLARPNASSALTVGSAGVQEVVQKFLEQQRQQREARAAEPGADANMFKKLANGLTVEFFRAGSRRASRAARPSEGTREVQNVAEAIAVHCEQQLKALGRTRLKDGEGARHRTAVGGSKGPGVRAAKTEDQAKLNHVATLKARSVDSCNQEASTLLNGYAAAQCYSRLLEAAFRANAVGAAITNRSPSQGAALQTTRCNSKTVDAAAAAQVAQVAITLAKALHDVSTASKRRNPVAPCVTSLGELRAMQLRPRASPEAATLQHVVVPIASTSQLVFNAMPAKIGPVSIRSAARQLAAGELSADQVISDRISSANYMLTAICEAVCGDSEIDAMWAAVVLIVYLTNDPRGRPLLRTAGLTEVDVYTATVMESYGRAEIVRRERLRMAQQAQQQQQQQPQAQGGGRGRGRGRGRGGAARKRAHKDADVYVPAPSPPGWDAGAALDDEDEDDWEPPVTAGTSLPVPSPMAASVASGSTNSPAASTMDPADRVMSSKKRRTSKGSASYASANDSYGYMQWWYYVLLRSKETSVLETLVANTKSAVREAAQATLQRQGQGSSSVASNRVLQDISSSNAVKCAEAMVPFVSRRDVETPAVVAWKGVDGEPCVGIVRTPTNGPSHVLHACVPSRVFSAETSDHLILHSTASQELAPATEERYMRPGVVEAYAELSARPDARREAALQRFLSTHTQRPLPTAVSGLTRTIILAPFPMHRSAHLDLVAACGTLRPPLETADRHARDIVSFQQNWVDARDGGRRPPADVWTKNICMLTRDVIEPYCLPCPRFGVGIRVNELLRRQMLGRTRKNGPTKLSLGPASTEGSKDAPPIMDAEPLPLATLTDVTIEHTGTLALHVCLEAGVRVCDVVTEMAARPDYEPLQGMALLLVGSSQASFIAEMAGAVSSSRINESVSSSKRMSCADNQTWLGLSLYDALVGGLNNQQRAFAGTPYSGTYTSLVDTGITPAGLMGHFYVSDKRQHGSMCLSTSAADRIAKWIAPHHWVPTGGDHYVQRPAATCGLPNGLIPGVHAATEHYAAALETKRALENRKDEPYTEGVFVLPFSNVTQCLAPDVEATVDSTMRFAFRNPEENAPQHTGRSYLPDATDEEMALLREPLFRRPCIASIGDNPWATSYEHMEGFYNAACLVAEIAYQLCPHGRQRTGSACVLALMQWLAALHDEEQCVECLGSAVLEPHLKQYGYYFALVAMTLLASAIYPGTWHMTEPMVPSGYAKAMATQARRLKAAQDPRLKEGHRALPLRHLDLSKEEFAECRKRWKAFYARGSPTPGETSAWCNGIALLLESIVDMRGQHGPTNNSDAMEELRDELETAVRGAWYAHSPDGVQPPPKPCPAWHCAEPADIRRKTLDPVFVASEDLKTPARGCLVGIKPHQLRQLYALMLSAHLPDVAVQVYRNEGNLNLRVSSAADIKEVDGCDRSNKACAATQTESDAAAFGTVDPKLDGCVRQREAWDANALLLAPAVAPVLPPLPAARRVRGEFGDASFARAQLHRDTTSTGDRSEQEWSAHQAFLKAGAFARTKYTMSENNHDIHL